jgi:hypothetical protein
VLSMSLCYFGQSEAMLPTFTTVVAVSPGTTRSSAALLACLVTVFVQREMLQVTDGGCRQLVCACRHTLGRQLRDMIGS